jgi:hypothetical protein
LVERLLLVDHLIEVKHGGTEGTETHGGLWRGYREATVKARTKEVSGETIAAAIVSLLVNFNTDLLRRPLHRVLNG